VAAAGSSSSLRDAVQQTERDAELVRADPCAAVIAVEGSKVANSVASSADRFERPGARAFFVTIA
jgi:hypothetical protein